MTYHCSSFYIEYKPRLIRKCVSIAWYFRIGLESDHSEGPLWHFSYNDSNCLSVLDVGSDSDSPAFELHFWFIFHFDFQTTFIHSFRHLQIKVHTFSLSPSITFLVSVTLATPPPVGVVEGSTEYDEPQSAGYCDEHGCTCR